MPTYRCHKDVNSLLLLALNLGCWLEVCQGRAAALFGMVSSSSSPAVLFSKNQTKPDLKQACNEQDKVVCKDGVCWRVDRGGWQLQDDDDAYENDTEEYEEYDEEFVPPPRPQHPRSPPRRSLPNRHPPPSRQGKYNDRRRRGPSALSSAASLAQKTVGLTTTVASTTLKSSGKAAYYLVSPKHVSRPEVWGVWRLDQQVGTPDGPSISCAANVEFTPRGLVLTKYQEDTFESTFLFKERSWPKSCMVEFEARAFQGPNDREPVLMRYKGYFRRKLADSSVIKIVGNIYEVRKGGLWRGGGGSRKVGTFVARRRVMARKRVTKEEEEEEYDDYDDNDDLDDLEDDKDDSNDYDREYDSDEVYDDDDDDDMM